MEQGFFEILRNECIAKSTFIMTLEAASSATTPKLNLRPGQFINIKLDGLFLRRPISICDSDGKSITVVYKIVGKGTEHMSRMKEGETLDVLAGLGNGFDTSKSGKFPLLIGGGAGCAPMFWLCKTLIAEGKRPQVIMGFNTKDEVFLKDRFQDLGAEVLVATADGSAGIRGFVTDAMPKIREYDYLYVCGPEPMLKAVYYASGDLGGQFSFEERMGCGFGACMGCSCKTKYGAKRICRDGPILEKEEIIW